MGLSAVLWIHAMSTWSTFEDPFNPMSPTAVTVARWWFGTVIPEGMPMPTGLLIGEQPGALSNHGLPLWPNPAYSAGGRLFVMSGMPVAEYLTRLARVNLARQPVKKWDVTAAHYRAMDLAAKAPVGFRVVLCGARARDAFGMPKAWFEPVATSRAEYVAIPHPSGRNREYDRPDVAGETRKVLRWAAGYEEGTMAGDGKEKKVCEKCGQNPCQCPLKAGI